MLSDTVAASQLVILVSDVNRGRFSRLNNPDITVFNFTQYEINNGQIQFTHDDSYNTPSYQIAVFDGFNTTNPQSVVVDFDQKPKWVTQQITVYNRGELQLNAEQWLATDDKSNDQVFFELQNVTHGKYSAVSDIFAIPISNFTQAQVNASQIRFIHDGSNIAPSCSVRVSDGRLYVTYQPCQFNFIANRAPQLTINRLSLVKGEQKVVDSTSLAATDPDESTASELGQLLFNFTAIQHGQFSLSTNPSAVISSAYQSQVAAGQLLFQHDGSENSPSYNVTVSDGFVSTESQAANISFSLTSNPQSQIIRDNTNAAIGGAIGGVGGAVLLAGIGIFGAYRYRRSQQLADQRSNYPLANALYHELNIAGTEDFQSEKGINFINAVDSLNNELIRAGVDIKQMVPAEIEELAHKLATATKAQLGKKINPLDIQDYAQGIVRTAMTLSGKKKSGDDVLVEMDPIPTSAGQKLLQDAFGELLQKKGFGMQTLSAEQAKMIAEKLIKTVEENLNPSEGSTSSFSQPTKTWRPGTVVN